MTNRSRINKQASCADNSKGDLLSVEAAEQRIFSSLKPLHAGEIVDVRQPLLTAACWFRSPVHRAPVFSVP